MAYDRERTTYLERFRITVLRFTNVEVAENIEGVMANIQEAVNLRIDKIPETTTAKTTAPVPPP
jgi:very-short-patch-repair endonuclease